MGILELHSTNVLAHKGKDRLVDEHQTKKQTWGVLEVASPLR